VPFVLFCGYTGGSYESFVAIYSSACGDCAFDGGDCACGCGGVQAVAGFAFAADRLSDERYKSGIDSYLNVITAQATLLSNQRTAVNLQMQQMTTSVELIKALGGGWNQSELPTPKQLVK
jgi:hypothetical protein